MRKLEYLSPTSISSFHKNREQFYIDYLADAHPPRMPQTQPMSIGSAFDAYVKSALHEAIFGKSNDPNFDRDALFEKQVEKHNRDWAKVHGEYVFQAYKKSGAYNDLLVDLKGATKEPRFEIEIRGVVQSETGMQREMGNMILLGKPDLFYHNKEGYPVILDWKVNGYCSKSAKSPSKGYIKIRHCDGITAHDGKHKEAMVARHHGMMINIAHYLEDVDESWADQLAIYGWLLGQEVGTDYLTFIDQIVCAPNGEYPKLRIAEHRCRVSKEHQIALYGKACHVWDIIHSDHIFREMTKMESQAKCKELDGNATVSKEMAFSEDPQMKALKELLDARQSW